MVWLISLEISLRVIWHSPASAAEFRASQSHRRRCGIAGSTGICLSSILRLLLPSLPASFPLHLHRQQPLLDLVQLWRCVHTATATTAAAPPHPPSPTPPAPSLRSQNNVATLKSKHPPSFGINLLRPQPCCLHPCALLVVLRLERRNTESAGSSRLLREILSVREIKLREKVWAARGVHESSDGAIEEMRLPRATNALPPMIL